MNAATNTHKVYSTSGHAKKLDPIIHSLNLYDHDPKVWLPIKQRVDALTHLFDQLSDEANVSKDEKRAIQSLRDLVFDTIRMQSNLFHEHRRTCVDALRLRVVEFTPVAQGQPAMHQTNMML